VAEIALAVMLVIGAGLLIKTFRNLTSVDAGFDVENRVTFGLVLPQATYPDSQRRVQFFEELGWAGFVQHRLQARYGALKASLLVALAFAFLHLPTYLRAPISGQSVVRDLSVLVIVIPFAIAFRILIAFAYNRTAHAVLIAAITHASFNEASELISPNVPGPLAQLLAFASVGLLALLAVVLTRGALAYNRDRPRASTRAKSTAIPVAMPIAANPPSGSLQTATVKQNKANPLRPGTTPRSTATRPSWPS